MMNYYFFQLPQRHVTQIPGTFEQGRISRQSAIRYLSSLECKIREASFGKFGGISCTHGRLRGCVAPPLTMTAFAALLLVQ